MGMFTNLLGGQKKTFDEKSAISRESLEDAEDFIGKTFGFLR